MVDRMLCIYSFHKDRWTPYSEGVHGKRLQGFQVFECCWEPENERFVPVTEGVQWLVDGRRPLYKSMKNCEFGYFEKKE